MVIGPDTSRQARLQDYDEIDAMLAALPVTGAPGVR